MARKILLFLLLLIPHSLVFSAHGEDHDDKTPQPVEEKVENKRKASGEDGIEEDKRLKSGAPPAATPSAEVARRPAHRVRIELHAAEAERNRIRLGEAGSMAFKKDTPPSFTATPPLSETTCPDTQIIAGARTLEQLLKGCDRPPAPLVKFSAERVAKGSIEKMVVGVNPENPSIPNEFYCFCSNTFLYPVKLACGHIFCRACIQRARLLNNLCPLCRAKVQFTDYYNADDELMKKMLAFNRKMVIDRIIESSPDENSIRNLVHLCKCLGFSEVTYNNKWTCTLLINSAFHLHFTYNPQLSSLMLYVSIADKPDRGQRLNLLEKFLSKGMIKSSENEHCAVGLVPGRTYIILRRSLNMTGARDDALRNSAVSFVTLTEKYLNSLKLNSVGDGPEFALDKQLITYTVKEIMERSGKDPTYWALGQILKAWEFKIDNLRMGHDMENQELVCECPILTLPKESDERLEKLERICERILWGIGGLYLKDNVLHLVTREPATAGIMVQPEVLKKKLLDGHVMNFYKWREFLNTL